MLSQLSISRFTCRTTGKIIHREKATIHIDVRYFRSLVNIQLSVCNVQMNVKLLVKIVRGNKFNLQEVFNLKPNCLDAMSQ